MLNLKLNCRKESLRSGNNGLNGNNIFKLIRHFISQKILIASNNEKNSNKKILNLIFLLNIKLLDLLNY